MLKLIFFKEKVETIFFLAARDKETPTSYYAKFFDTESKKKYKCIAEGCIHKSHYFATYDNYYNHYYKHHSLQKKDWLLRSDVEKYGSTTSNISTSLQLQQYSNSMDFDPSGNGSNHHSQTDKTNDPEPFLTSSNQNKNGIQLS